MNTVIEMVSWFDNEALTDLNCDSDIAEYSSAMFQHVGKHIVKQARAAWNPPAMCIGICIRTTRE